MSTVFKKIVEGQEDADIVYQDDRVTAFWDISPQAPVHILIVPNRVIPSANELTPDDEALVGHMFFIAKKIAADQGLAERGYRLMINCGREGGQTIDHLHVHLLGGRPLGPMLAR